MNGINNMIKKILLPLLISSNLFFISSIHGAAPRNFLFNSDQPSYIEINNRILTSINGKPITVYDLAKKLDVSFYQQYPQYADSIAIKYQYYDQNWKFFLKDLINKELILSEAAELKVEVSSGDIRQEMEKLFGPNIISNLDKLGLSYEDAQELIESDLILHRMLGMRVHMKCLRKMTPQAVFQAYEDYCKTNIRLQEWDFNIISIRHRSSEQALEVANTVYELITQKNIPFVEIPERLKALGLYDDELKLNISSTIHNNEKDISESYKNILNKMRINSYTTPILNVDRDGKSQFYRIFYLEKMVPGGKVPFEEIENKIMDELRAKITSEETEKYLESLIKYFHITEDQLNPTISNEYKLFTLH